MACSAGSFWLRRSHETAVEIQGYGHLKVWWVLEDHFQKICLVCCQVSAGVSRRLRFHHMDLCLSVLMICHWILPDEGSKTRGKWKPQNLLWSSLGGQNVSCLRYFHGDGGELCSVWKGAEPGYESQVKIILETSSHT